MGKHHTEDYKLSAAKYALRTDNQVETCEVFDCKKSSLQDWLKLYDETGSPVRHTVYSLCGCLWCTCNYNTVTTHSINWIGCNY